MTQSCATMCYMKNSRVGVRELRQNLSVYLERVKAGEVLEVTDRNHPVAVLAPLPGAASPLERLVVSGRAGAPVGDLTELGMPEETAVSTSLSDALELERGERLS